LGVRVLHSDTDSHFHPLHMSRFEVSVVFVHAVAGLILAVGRWLKRWLL